MKSPDAMLCAAVAGAVLGVVLLFPRPVCAQLRLPELVSDGMVMQRGAEVPVWGWSDGGEDVRIAFRGETYIASPGISGTWRVTLPPMEAGGPYDLTVATGGERKRVRSVMVGDVWITSGQSNMEWTVANAQSADAAIAAANDRSIRHFKVPKSWAQTSEETLAGGTWKEARPQTVGAFTAVGYFFARALRKHVDVPIGLINTSWGGSRIEPWMSAGTLGIDEKDVHALVQQEQARVQRSREALRERIGSLPQEAAGLVDGEARWAAPSLGTFEWRPIAVPSRWAQVGYGSMDGIGWYRTTFDLTAEEARKPLRLSLGPIDDADITWVNSQEVGRTGVWNTPRVYDAPASALTAGENVIAVRVENTGGEGGIYGDPDMLHLEMASGEKRSLDGSWVFRVGEASVNAAMSANQLPTLLYNKMIYPLLDYPIAGVLWYQGESNANDAQDAFAYRRLFTDMIESWRDAWAGSGEFPFLFVQLANLEPGGQAAADTSWAVLRESQSQALALPNTAQAVTIDVGNPADIHPRDKQTVGRRLARAARALAYGDAGLTYSGPRYRSYERVGDGRVALSFNYADGRLKARGGRLKGFAIAGADGRFVPAEACVEGERVIVHSDRVEKPSAVRYAWSNNPEEANLYNAEGLPAAPLRTDAPQTP